MLFKFWEYSKPLSSVVEWHLNKSHKQIYCELSLCLMLFQTRCQDINMHDIQWTTYWHFKYWKILPHEQSLHGSCHQVCQRVSFVAKIPTPASLLLRIILSKQEKIRIVWDVKQNTFPSDSLCLNKTSVNKTPHWLLLVSLYTHKSMLEPVYRNCEKT